ncbi:RICIN domain-containing protein [Dactylosporangium sp. NPDC050588]|uniref:RICIN domain-containing protein n=1 Tax=Dactylosporangium sp. NPDC050588 TaxID=3157211 RepID=UPI0033C772E6
MTIVSKSMRLLFAVTLAAGGVVAVSAPARAADGEWERLSSFATDKVAAVPAPYTTNDLQVVTAEYGNMAYNGQWKFTPLGNDRYTIQNRYSNQCLDTLGGLGSTAGTPVVQNPCDQTTSQKWVLIRDNGLQIWRITNDLSGLALAVETGVDADGVGFVLANNARNNTKQMFQKWA